MLYRAGTSSRLASMVRPTVLGLVDTLPWTAVAVTLSGHRQEESEQLDLTIPPTMV